MKLDSGIHIDMHSVFFLKPGVTQYQGAIGPLNKLLWLKLNCTRDGDGFVSLTLSSRPFCCWTTPFFSYLTKSSLKLGLSFSLLFLEFFPELPEWPVRPVWADLSEQTWRPFSVLAPRALNPSINLQGSSSLELTGEISRAQISLYR